MIAITLKRARRRRLNRLLAACITIALAVGLVLVWIRVVQTLREPSSAPRYVGQPGALVWDGRVFTSASQLKVYLEAHGLSYSRWAARHPTAFGAPAPVTARHPATTTKKTAAKTTTTPTKPKPVPHRVAAPEASVTKSRPLAALVLMILLTIGGLALGASALVPYRLAPAAVQRLYADPDRRMVAFAAATAMLLGLGVSLYLS